MHLNATFDKSLLTLWSVLFAVDYKMSNFAHGIRQNVK